MNKTLSTIIFLLSVPERVAKEIHYFEITKKEVSTKFVPSFDFREIELSVILFQLIKRL